MKRISSWFLSGVAVVLPLGVTVYALVWGFDLVDSTLSRWTQRFIGDRIPGLAIVMMVLLLIVIGMLASNVFGNKVLKAIQKRVSKIPVIKLIYNPVNKIVTDFSSKNSDAFQKVVLVDFPMPGVKSVGFVTNSKLSVNGNKKISVFVPTVPNPTNGHMIIVEEKDIQVLDLTIAEGVNVIVTMGSVLEKPLSASPWLYSENKFNVKG